MAHIPEPGRGRRAPPTVHAITMLGSGYFILGGGSPRDFADSCMISLACRIDCCHMRGLRLLGGGMSSPVAPNMEPPH